MAWVYTNKNYVAHYYDKENGKSLCGRFQYIGPAGTEEAPSHCVCGTCLKKYQKKEAGAGE